MKKTALTIIAILTAQLAFAAPASIDLGTRAGYTPYDRYMSPVKQVLAHLSGSTVTMDQVRQWMSEGRSFRYSFTDPYTAADPQTTAATHSGDCKAKSLWLANQINDPNIRFVIGRARSSSRMSHAWLMWKNQSEGRWYILDCTNTREPIPADRINPTREYIPLYSYTKDGSYLHRSAEPGMANVASNSQYTVAANN